MRLDAERALAVLSAAMRQHAFPIGWLSYALAEALFWEYTFVYTFRTSE